jgi:GH15 family glucan-1,4-alpha-glucosidase
MEPPSCSSPGGHPGLAAQTQNRSPEAVTACDFRMGSAPTSGDQSAVWPSPAALAATASSALGHSRRQRN